MKQKKNRRKKMQKKNTKSESLVAVREKERESYTLMK